MITAIDNPGLELGSHYLEERDWIMIFGDDLRETFLAKCKLQKRFPTHRIVILEPSYKVVSKFGGVLSIKELKRLKMIFSVNKEANLLHADRLKLMIETWAIFGFKELERILFVMTCKRYGISDRNITNDFGLSFNLVLDWNEYLENIESYDFKLL